MNVTSTSKRFSLPQKLLVLILFAHGFVEQCCASPTSHACSPASLVNKVDKQSFLEIKPSRLLVGSQPEIRTQHIAHVKRSLEKELFVDSDELFNYIERSSGAWVKPEHETAWEKMGLPKDTMIKYGDLANSGMTKQSYLLLCDESAKNWKKISPVPKEKKAAARDWFETNIRIEGESACVFFEKIQWCAMRAHSGQRFWWKWHQIDLWSQKTEKWQLMIEVGDLLGLYHKDLNACLREEEVQKVKNRLRNKLLQFNDPVPWHANQHWGRFQVYEALRGAVIPDLKDGKSLYEARVEILLGALGPNENLAKLATKLHVTNLEELRANPDNNKLENLELHWLLKGLDPSEAMQVGKAMGIVLDQPSCGLWSLTKSERDCVNNLKSLLNQQAHGASPVLRWYAKAFGRRKYEKVALKVETSYQFLIRHTTSVIQSVKNMKWVL